MAPLQSLVVTPPTSLNAINLSNRTTDEPWYSETRFSPQVCDSVRCAVVWNLSLCLFWLFGSCPVEGTKWPHRPSPLRSFLAKRFHGTFGGERQHRPLVGREKWQGN